MNEPTMALDASTGNGEMFAALASAQAGMVSLGKDGHNKQAGYRYTTAEELIRASRKPLGEQGLAIVHGWSFTLKEMHGDIGQRDAMGVLRISFAVMHEGGGYISGHADVGVIGGRRTPHDKAIMAALTYAYGFILRSVLNIDRDEEGESIDARVDKEPPPPPEPPIAPIIMRLQYLKAESLKAGIIPEGSVVGFFDDKLKTGFAWPPSDEQATAAVGWMEQALAEEKA